MIDNSNGRKWARFWLIVALIVSVVANVAHTVLATSDITLWLRVPGAVVWPLFTFAGIEVVVRMIWERRWTHTLTRWCILAAAVPAAITSYSHQYNLLGMMGEEKHTQIIGPIAVDGFMVGLTMALLLTRQLPAPEAAHTASVASEHEQPMSDEQLEQIVERWSSEQPAPVSPAPMLTAPEQPSEQRAPRAPRPASEQTEQRVRELLADPELKAGTDNSTIRRYAKVARQLRDNPAGEVDCSRERVKPELVAIIREHMNLERAR